MRQTLTETFLLLLLLCLLLKNAFYTTNILKNKRAKGTTTKQHSFFHILLQILSAFLSSKVILMPPGSKWKCSTLFSQVRGNINFTVHPLHPGRILILTNSGSLFRHATQDQMFIYIPPHI
jgi:hypothetical protein